MELAAQSPVFIAGGSAGERGGFTKAFHHILDHIIPHSRNNYHPHLFSHGAMALFSALLVTVKISGLAVLALGPVVPAYSSAITPSNIISLTNQSRQEYNLKPLAENSVLNKAAQAKAQDMLAKGYFSHNSPDGRTPWDFIIASGYNYLNAGENLAINFSEAENVEDAWMKSPGHKANILNKNFEEIGIGIAQGEYQGHTAIFVVQMFGTAAEQKVALLDKPTILEPETAVQQTPVVNNGKLETPTSEVKDATTDSVIEVLAIRDTTATLESSAVKVGVQTSNSAVKVLATYGKQAIMLEPKSGNVWEGSIPTEKLVAGENTLVQIKAYDISGNIVKSQVATFSGSTPASFYAPGKAGANDISFFGYTINPTEITERFYLLFMAGMLTALVVAIATKRHIQHISLVANGSFVIMLACILWMV